MQKIKNEKGVTLVALVITIIVTIILASITMTIGMDSVNSTKDRKLQSELQMVGQATITEYTKALELNYIKEGDTIPPANFIGDRIENISSVSLQGGKTWKLSDSEAKGYKSYFRLSPEQLKELEILNSEHTYIINYYTGEVYNETKEKASNGEALYIRIKGDVITEKPTDNTSFVE